MRQDSHSAGHVQDGVCFLRVLAQLLIALAVGRMSNWTWRGSASLFTLSMTGSAPVPVPMISRLHFHGIFSFAESGVWPKASREFVRDLEAYDFGVEFLGTVLQTRLTLHQGWV